MFAPSARLGNNGKKSDACCEHKSPDALRNVGEKSGECGRAGGGERTCDGIAEVVDHQNPSDARLVGAVRKVLRSQASTQLLNDVQKLFVHRKRFGFILFFIFTISLSPQRGGRNGGGPPIRETVPWCLSQKGFLCIPALLEALSALASLDAPAGTGRRAFAVALPAVPFPALPRQHG